MSTGLYLALVYTLIPLAVIVLAAAGRPLLALPQRFFPRLSEDTAYTGGVATVVALGLTLMLALGLAGAFRLDGLVRFPASLLGLNLSTLYVLLLLVGVPLAVVGLIRAAGSMLAWPRPATPGLLSIESVYALSAAVLIDLGVLAEVWLVVQLAAG
jgi:hypothetical protein